MQTYDAPPSFFFFLSFFLKGQPLIVGYAIYSLPISGMVSQLIISDPDQGQFLRPLPGAIYTIDSP